MDSETSSQNRFSRLSLARRLLVGALLWSALLVVGGVVTISAVYRAEAVNILDDEHSGTLQTLARAIRPLDDGTGRIEDIEDRHPLDPRFTVPLSGKYWMMLAVDENGAPVGDITSRSVFDETIELPEALKQDALSNPGQVLSANGIGPAEQPVRFTVQATTYPERANPVILIAISDRTLTMDGVDRLRTILLIAMLSLAGSSWISAFQKWMA